jgi:hypothetical protein
MQVADLPATFREIAAGSRCELAVPNDLGPEDRVRIGQLLQRLHTKFGVEIVTIKNTNDRTS